jgi:asparagine synthase (glutamine-hydrolysing)
MNFNCCYIDYSKSKKFDINIESKKPYKEIKYSGKWADIYFWSQEHSLFENSDFILLVDGSIDSLKDPEKLLELVSEFGIEELLKRVDGVFSLTIYDKKDEKFYITRDHFGLIQAYYYQHDDVILFSNRLKIYKNCSLFKKEIDFNTLGQYLQHGYIVEPYTIFLNCRKVLSAHFIEFDIKNRKSYEKKYWDIVDFYNLPRLELSEDEIIKKSEELLKNALNSRVNGSKKVGAFLSGGYDSSMIVSMLSQNRNIKLHTYTVGFSDEEVNEAPYAKKIANHFNINHHEHYFCASDLKDLIEDFAKVYDEPIADKAAIPTMLISLLAEDEVEIIFGGEGGDEIFASSGFLDKFKLLNTIPYPVRLIISKLLCFMPKSTRNIKWSAMLKERNIENVIKYKDIIQNFDAVDKLIKADIVKRDIEFDNSNINSSSHYLDRIFPLMLKSYVSNNLLSKIDFATKYYNLKPKVPYLDRKFVEFMAQVDVGVKRKSDMNKYILKKMLDRYIPTELIDRPKKGFDVPIGSLLKNELRDFLDLYINRDRVEQEGIFDVDELMAMKSRFLNSNSYYDEQNIWNILIFELWYEEWFSK